MRYLLVALLLVSAVSAQWVLESVNCEEVRSDVVDTSLSIPVHFEFEALAPYLSDRDPVILLRGETPTTTVWGSSFYNVSLVYMAGLAYSGRWDRDLRYEITVDYWSGFWDLSLYRCTATWQYGNYSWTETRHYYQVNREPPRSREAVVFTVSRDRVRHSETKYLSVSLRPDRRGYSPLCAELPSKNTWPNCGRPFTGENMVLSGSSPGLWTALEINGLRPGSVASKFGVNATMPDPWYYTDAGGDFPYLTATVSTDMGSRYIGDVYNLPFSSSISVTMVAVPARWGSVEFRPPKPTPLYISRVLATNTPRPDRPPETFLIGVGGNATWAGDRWVWNWTLASVAYRTPFMLTPYVAVEVGYRVFWMWITGLGVMSRGVEIRAPLGSIIVFRLTVFWRLEERGVWIGSYGTYLRAVDNNGVLLADHYEEVGAKGKLAVNEKEFAVAVDSSMQSVVTAWYAPPDPCRQWPQQIFNCVYSQHVFTKVKGSWTGYSRIGERGREQWPINKLVLVDWLIPSQPSVCGVDGFRDFMHLVAGDPVLYYWHTYRLRAYSFNPETGDWGIPGVCVLPPPHQVSLIGKVYGVSQYRNTTKDPYGSYKLFHQTAEGPFYNYMFEGVDGDERPAGWTDALPLGISSMVPNSTGPWALFLVPTTACTSLICTELKPTLWGPAPGLTTDLALSGAGYSFLLLYLGEAKTSTVRIYVEMGYVVEKRGDGVRHRWVKNYLLAEIKRAWRFLDAVYVGPGWHVGYKPLSACQPLELSVNAVYVAPVNWTGPVQVVVEDGERLHHFVFFVSNDVSYRITTSTPAPSLFTTPYLNTTVYLFLNGVPYFHGVNTLGEGGRQRQFACAPAPIRARSLLGGSDHTSQLAVSGDFWGHVELYGSLRIENLFSRPRFELVDPQRGVVRLTAEGPVRGFAFYLHRDGTWVKVGEAGGSCVAVNASRVYPWDPVLVLPLVGQEVTARPGDVVTLWRPQTALLFKTWADSVGYQRDARSELKILGAC